MRWSLKHLINQVDGVVAEVRFEIERKREREEEERKREKERRRNDNKVCE